uniref:Uncharacterized protein n=1 Tax=Noccaea caerulescens TaxID=107243 RepID=A0A1J3GMN0_NOCCA
MNLLDQMHEKEIFPSVVTDMIVASKEQEAEDEPEVVGRITRSSAREMAKEARSLIAEGSLNLPMIQVFNIVTLKTSPGNDN